MTRISCHYLWHNRVAGKTAELVITVVAFLEIDDSVRTCSRGLFRLACFIYPFTGEPIRYELHDELFLCSFSKWSDVLEIFEAVS